MLASMRLGGDFSRECAYPAARLLICATHPQSCVIRELTRANANQNASHNKGNEANLSLPS
jgi:hypothetical protein